MANNTKHVLITEKLTAFLSATIQERGIKIKWVAAKAGLDYQFVAAILRGEKTPSINTLINLGEALGLELKVDWKPIKRPD